MKTGLVRLAILALAAAMLVPQAAVTTAATIVTCQYPQLTPTKTVYFPNITKSLGGPNGWQTPFIVQNVGTVSTTLEIALTRFSDGQLQTCHRIEGLAPGASFAENPNDAGDLQGDTQYSAVVRSYGSSIVGVVNECSYGCNQTTGGTLFEASSYNGVSSGATSVFLPNITKRFFGFVTRFVIQNLGNQTTTASADFLSFDGTKHPAPITRTLTPGQSQFIDPNVEPSLVDGTQYSVTVTAQQPIAVRVGTQSDDPGNPTPMLDATMGITTGATTIYGPYAVKGVPGKGKGFSTIVLQNLSTSPADLSMTFTPLGGGASTTFTKSGVAGHGAWDFDIRFQNGDAKAQPQVLCGTTAATGCLADGEYSISVTTTTSGAQIAGIVNIVGTTTLAIYAALPSPSTTVFLPNVTRTLGGANGWTTPIFLQNTTPNQATATVIWKKFSDASQALSENVTIAPNASVRLDPRDRNLPDNTQFAVTVTSATALSGIVEEISGGDGDGVMAYQGFGPVADEPVASDRIRFTGKVTTSTGAAAANVCVKIGSVPNCTTYTDAAGNYSYEINVIAQQTFTFHYLVNGVEKASQTINPPYAGGTTITLPTIALTQ